MTEKEKKTSKKKANLSKSCEKKYGNLISIQKSFSINYLFIMLLYSIMIYYGYNKILIDYILEDISNYQEAIIIIVFMVITFILFNYISYKKGKFKFLYHFIYVILSVILANIGFLFFLVQNFQITPMEIINIFLYLILVGLITSIISYILLRFLIFTRCKNVKSDNNDK